MTYADIVKMDSDKIKESIKSISDFLENLPESHQDCVTKELVKQIGIFSDGHFNHATADYIVNKMKPAHGTKSVKEMLNEMGVTAATAKEAIQSAYSKAREYGLQHSFNAPSIPDEYTDCDYYVALAMIISDFWYTGEQDPTCYSMLAYQWMADPDSKPTKVWDYFCFD